MEAVRNMFNFRRRGGESSGSSGGRDVPPGRSAGYDLKDRDLGKLHKAASVGDLAKVKQLIKQRSDINQTDKQLRTALHVACAVGRVHVVQFLVDSDAGLNLLDGEGRTPLMKAVQGQHEACVRVLLENHAEPDLADGEGNTALHLSASLPSVTVTQLLLNCPVDINACNQDGLTPLNLAVRGGHVEIVQLLLEEGADFDVNDPGNTTPLMEAQSPTSMTRLSAEASLSVSEHKPLTEEADFTEDKPLTEEADFTEDKPLTEEADFTEHKPLTEEADFTEDFKPLTEEADFTEHKPLTEEADFTEDFKPVIEESHSSVDKPLKKVASSRLKRRTNIAFKPRHISSSEDSETESAPPTPHFRRLPNRRPDALPSTNTSKDKKTGFMSNYILEDCSFSESDDDSPKDNSPHTQRFPETPGAEGGADEPSTSTSALTSGLGEKEISTDEDETEEIPESNISKRRAFMAELGLEESDYESDDDSVPQAKTAHEEQESDTEDEEETQSHDGSDEDSDLHSDVYDGAEDGLAFPEPDAASSSDNEEFELEEEPEGISDDEDKETNDQTFNSSPLLSTKPQSHDSDDYSDLESENDEAEDEPISPEPNAASSSDNEEFEFEEEPEGISDDEDKETNDETFNYSSLLSPKPQSHDSDDFSDLESDNDAHDRAEDEPVSPEPNTEFEEEPEGISDDKEILEEETAPSRFNSSPKPQSHDSDDFSDLESENDADERAEDYSDLESENDEAEDEPVSPEPNADRTSESEPEANPEEVDDNVEDIYEGARDDLVFPEPDAEFEEEPEGISDDEEILEEESAPSSLNSSPLSSPKPQSHDSDDFSDLESENDEAEDEPISPEPDAATSSDNEVFEYEEEPEGISDDDSDLESDNNIHDRAEDEPVSPEPNTDRTSESEAKPEEANSDGEDLHERAEADHVSPEQTHSEESELKEEPEGISDDEEILSPEPQIHADPDCESDQDSDVYDGAGDEHMIPEPDAATTSDSEEFELQEEPEGRSSKPDSDLDSSLSDNEVEDEEEILEEESAPSSLSDNDVEDGEEILEEESALSSLSDDEVEDEEEILEEESAPSSLSDNEVEDEEEILEEESAPSSLNSSPLLSPKPQSHEHPEYDSGWESDSEVYERTQEEPGSGQENEQESFRGDDGETLKEKKEIQSLEELNFMEDLTQSSDTASDDLESFMQELDSSSLDSASSMKVQNVFREYERAVQTLKNKNSRLSNKVKQLETEKADLKNSLDDVSGVKPELQMEVDHLKRQLKQEQENRRQVTASHNAMKDKLQQTEEQNQLQVREKQQMEFALRNRELEVRTLVVSVKRLEEEHGATQKLLAHERSARALQDELLHRQQEVKEENADLLQKTSTLQEQVRSLTAELERLRADGSLKEKLLFEESESLKEQLQNAEREAKANGDALSQTAIACTHHLAALKSQLGLVRNNLEHEKKARETLEKEADSSRARLAAGAQEVERWAEKSQRLEDRLTADAARHYGEVSGLCVKLSHSQSDAAELRRRLQDADDDRDAKEAALVNAQKELRDQVCALEEQKACALEDLEQLKEKLSQREDQRVRAEKRFAEKEAELQMRHERLKRKALSIREQRNDAETRVKQGETRVKQVETRLKQVETSLSQKVSSNSDLQRKLDSLQTTVKTTEKRLRDQDKTGDFIMNMDLQELLDRETLQRRRLVKDNDELREELSSVKRSEQRRVDELQELRRRTDFAQRERSLTEGRSRDELKHKLEQVDLFLQTQAASQKAQDQINANNAAQMQSRLEQRIRELEGEVSRVRSATADGLAVRSELDRYRSMYSEENLLRKSLAARLERSNARLTDAQTRLLTERTKYLIATSGLDSPVGESRANTAIEPDRM